MRKEAVIALGKIGPAAEAAIPALTAMQDEGVDEYHVNQVLKEIRGYWRLPDLESHQKNYRLLS